MKKFVSCVLIGVVALSGTLTATAREVSKGDGVTSDVVISKEVEPVFCFCLPGEPRPPAKEKTVITVLDCDGPVYLMPRGEGPLEVEGAHYYYQEC